MSEEKKKPLIIIGGPTASGKSALAVSLARRIGGEVISADSMQIYKGMDIGAKTTAEEMQGIPHHLIDELEPDEPYNVVLFKEKADRAAAGILERGRIPIAAGGTGFYIQALLRDIRFTPVQTDEAYRDKLWEISKETDGPARLHRLLQERDPESARQIHENNVKRVIRALEFYRQTGQRISEHNKVESLRPSPYNYAYFVLTRKRDELYRRIEERVDAMMADGLEEEVRRLKEAGYGPGLVSMQGIGYKEMLEYLDGRITLQEAVCRIKTDTRHFAKRQLTWFRREKDIEWIDLDQYSGQQEILDRMCRILKEKNIIETVDRKEYR